MGVKGLSWGAWAGIDSGSDFWVNLSIATEGQPLIITITAIPSSLSKIQVHHDSIIMK